MDDDMMDEGMMDEGMMDEGDMGNMPGDFVSNDDGSYSMTDEDGNFIEGAADGSMKVTSPDGGVVEMDADGNFIRGSINDDGKFTFDYTDDAVDVNKSDADEKAKAEKVEKTESEEPDVAFEDLYGISEDEFNAMSTDEKDEFLKKHYS